MGDSNVNMGMLLREARNVETVSRDIALQYAELVFSHNYGKECTDRQKPFVVLDHGDRWEIHGTNIVASSLDLADPIGGRLVMVIKKTNGEILDLTRELVSE